MNTGSDFIFLGVLHLSVLMRKSFKCEIIIKVLSMSCMFLLLKKSYKTLPSTIQLSFFKYFPCKHRDHFLFVYLHWEPNYSVSSKYTDCCFWWTKISVPGFVLMIRVGGHDLPEIKLQSIIRYPLPRYRQCAEGGGKLVAKRQYLRMHQHNKSGVAFTYYSDHIVTNSTQRVCEG